MMCNTVERAPLLLAFGDLAERMARLIRACPGLVGRLVVAPREAVHSVGAYLHLSAANRADEEVARTLDTVDPRKLLSTALPGCPPTLYRALDRAGDRVQSRQFYSRLGGIARGPFGDALLHSDRRLDHARLDHYEALASMDPAVRALTNIIPESTYQMEAIDALLALLRARGALREADLALPPKAGLRAILRRLQAAIDRLTAPDPGFQPPSGFRFLRSTSELQNVGRAFQNCVALPQFRAGLHHVRLLDGSGAYLVSDIPPLLVEMRHVCTNVWVLEQMAGPKNAPPPPGMREAVVRDLTTAGLRIISTDPASALSRLTDATRRAPRFLQDDEDEGEEVAA